MRDRRKTAEKRIGKNHKRRMIWQRIVRSMAMVVVFCTTYALILPAITMQTDTICGLESHVHTGSCYESHPMTVLVCTPDENEEHTHRHEDSCWAETGESLTELICTLPEHTHTADCYPVEAEENLDLAYHCGFTAHTHLDTCWDEAGNLTCSVPEHNHEAGCVAQEINLKADVESSIEWWMMTNRLKKTGVWREDLLTLAKSQIGYAESSRNCVLEDDSLRGYTRYGDWYGNAYQPWDDVFIAFCLNYADIPEEAIPWSSDTARWISALEQKNLLMGSDEILPQPGDLVFCKNKNGQIFPAVLLEFAADETNLDTLQYRVIAGDVNNQVATLTVAKDNILWICNLDHASDQYELLMSGVKLETENDTMKAEEATEATETAESPVQTDNITSVVDKLSDVLAAPGDEVKAYSMVTANPAQLQEGVDYVLYCGNGQNLTFLNSNLSAITVNNSGTGNAPYQINGSWDLTPGQLGNAAYNTFTWRITRQNGNMYLVCQQNQQRLTLHNGWLQLTNEGTALNNTVNGAGAIVGGQYKLRYDDQWRGTWTNDQGTYTTEPTTVYFARVSENTGNYPHAVHTGKVNIAHLRFYNICENGDSGVSALAGCVFEITGENGYTATVISENDPEVNLPDDIPDGVYTIREVSTPEGYIRDVEFERSFEIKNGALTSDRTIGTFINHSMEQLEASKTAEVEDYANRIYQILVSADSHLRMYEMEPIDLLFVVDQSNSMLFPSGLVDTGKRVTLRQDGANNVENLDRLNLDKTKMHYIIADPNGTSTVWAVWHDGTAWMCQDASYYAKAKHGNDPGYQDDNETVIFPSNQSYADQANSEGNGVRSNGCGIGKNLGSSSLGKYISNSGGSVEFVVYQSTDEYNRLHYLEEALSNLVYQLSDVNDENRITLTRFTKEVKDGDCYGPEQLTPDKTDELVEQITSIKTSGGTRQDIALKHIHQEHLSDEGEHYSDLDHTYTLLITDGAPVLSSNGGLTNLGGPNDSPTTTEDTVYGQIKGYANLVKQKSTLMTVGLGMESVEAGKSVLQQIATNNNFYCALDDASQLLQFVQKILFESFRPKDEIELSGDIVDEISDSFYPIAWVDLGSGAATDNRVLLSDSTRDWVLLEEHDWITLDGKLTSADAADAAGQLLRRENGTFYVQWLSQDVTHGWNGTVYVKAKEDFIGGNAIDTNKKADVAVHESYKEFETPTVNVRLLDMNEMNSEVTVFLGDRVNEPGNSPLDSLRYFYENTKFTKLISDDGSILNKAAVDGINGLEDAVFYLRYAMGRDLTEEEWARLANGDTIEVEYTYDDASSHGPVGKFIFRLEKTGYGSAYYEHPALSACQPGGQPLTENCDNPAETYTLHVTYQAYGLGENGRLEENLHNGTGSPGTEVGTGTTLPTGLGTVAKHNVHEVHVISGKIEILKRFGEGITDEADRTFTFTLHRAEDGADTTNDRTETITIPANGTVGNNRIVFDNLPRGTYTVTEAEDEDYTLKRISVLDSTNCYSEPPAGGADTTVIAVIGNNTANENVIGRLNESDRYTSYVDPVNGVYMAAEFTNVPLVYTAELPVEKIWKDSTGTYADDVVYVVLYLDGAPVLDAEGNARILRLDAASGWKGIFIVALADEEDTLSNYNYSIREASQVRTDNPLDWIGAILENDATTVLYYEKALEFNQLFAISGKSYLVDYAVGSEGQLTVTNSRAVDLPMTGGMGTYLYTISGSLLTAAALVIGCSQRRKKERGASG